MEEAYIAKCVSDYCVTSSKKTGHGTKNPPLQWKKSQISGRIQNKCEGCRKAFYEDLEVVQLGAEEEAIYYGRGNQKRH